MRILTVVGARPQFIKAATVSRVLRDMPDVQELLVHTGQHHDANMSDVFFQTMDIPRPAHHLGISGGGHGQMTGRMLEGLERVVLAEKPDWMLVYGDTNSTLAAALAASKLHLPIAHVEAGLRSYKLGMPEEINRILTDRVSALLFCPTTEAVQNLEKEGYGTLGSRIECVGDVMLDAALFYRDRAHPPAGLPKHLQGKPFALATFHRAENTDDPARLRDIVASLNRLHCDLPIVLPLHPRTRERLRGESLELRVHCIEPAGYLEMVWLLDQCRLVLTDSGGLQKEAWFFRKPCVTLRRETEWVELLRAEGNRLTRPDPASVRAAIDAALASAPDYGLELYGKGDAAARISAVLLEGPPRSFYG